LTVCKVEILDPQAHDFHQTQAAAVHDLGHEFVNPVHFCDHSYGFAFGEDGGNAIRSGGADGEEGGFVQFDIEHVTIEKENGTNSLVPLAPPARAGVSRGSNILFVDEVGNEGVDLGNTHVTRMTFVVMQDILARPGDIGLFGPQGVMAVAQGFPVLIEKFFSFRFKRIWGSVRFGGIGHGRRFQLLIFERLASIISI